MTQDTTVWEFDPIKILLVGAGGIGSQLAYIVVPALKELLSVRWRAWWSAEESIENPKRQFVENNDDDISIIKEVIDHHIKSTPTMFCQSIKHFETKIVEARHKAFHSTHTEGDEEIIEDVLDADLEHFIPSKFTIMDSDVVEKGNLTHQRFFPEDVGQPKVEALVNRLQSFVEKSNLKLFPIAEDLTDAEQLEGFDFVIVAVDNSEARLLVHKHAERWIDLRCGGDGYTCFDDSSDEEFVSQMTPPDQPRVSCQQPGAAEAGNIEMGYAMAAAHGAQWLIQSVRQKTGVSTHPPQPRTYSLTHGELNLGPATVTNSITARTAQANHGKRWTPAEIKQLHAEAREGRTITEMAESLGRTQGAIQSKLFTLIDFSCMPMRDIEAEGEA